MTDDANSSLELPNRLLGVFQQKEYSGHGRKQTDVICDVVGSDLLAVSDILSDAAASGELVSERNYTPSGHRFYQDIDYVIGTPTEPRQQSITTVSEPEFSNESVDEIWFALNVESLVSSVSKNWKNRGKDIHSFYLGVYDISPLAATGCIIVMNVSDLDRDPFELIEGYREFDFANGSLAQSLDTLAIIPIRYDDSKPHEAELVTNLIGPQDQLHYSSFIETLSDGIERRFQGQYQVSPESLESVLSRQESEIIEFKRKLPSNKKSLSNEVAALANHEGGALLLGVDDNGTPVGLDDIEETEERVSGILSENLTSAIRSIEKATVRGKDVLIINVQAMTSAPLDVDGTFYVRTGTTTDRLSGREIVDRFPR